MKTVFIVLGACLMLMVSAIAQTPAVPPDSAASPAPAHSPKTAEMSTTFSDLDSLDVLPQDVDTPHEGGMRRSHIESTVFRREKPVEYVSEGRRDPFRSLVVDEKKDGEIETDLLQLEGAILTGVVWSDGQYLALVRDKDGRNFFLREGDPVYLGHVTLVSQSQMSFEVTDFGDYQKVILKVRVKDKDREKGKDKG